MGLVPDRFKRSFRRPSSLPPPSPPPSAAAQSTDPPPEFLCPISGALMADPVIIPSGETFERACIEARRDLSLDPSSSSSSSPLMLIPNSALRSAILRWCDISGVPRPVSLSSETASRFLLSSNCKPITSSSSCSSSSDNSSSSSSSSETIAPKTLKPETLEEKIVTKLKHPQIQEQQIALTSLLESTRESASRRVSLCTPRLLSALRLPLLSRSPSLKSTALSIILNLSLEPPNKIRVLRSGLVPSIIDALQSSSKEHAAGALFSLALEEHNRTAIGVLGAVPPLLRLFCDSEAGLRARVEAGMALHYLGLAEMNMVKIGRVAGAVKGLVGVAERGGGELKRVAIRVMVGMVEGKEGRKAMLDGGGLEMAVGVLREGEMEEKEMGVRMLYGMSMGGLRFRGMGRRAGAEEVLQRVAEGLEGEGKEMAKMTIRVLRGEGERERDVGRILWGEEEEEGEEIVVARRTKNRDSGGGSGSDSAGF